MSKSRISPGFDLLRAPAFRSARSLDHRGEIGGAAGVTSPPTGRCVRALPYSPGPSGSRRAGVMTGLGGGRRQEAVPDRGLEAGIARTRRSSAPRETPGSGLAHHRQHLELLPAQACGCTFQRIDRHQRHDAADRVIAGCPPCRARAPGRCRRRANSSTARCGVEPLPGVAKRSCPARLGGLDQRLERGRGCCRCGDHHRHSPDEAIGARSRSASKGGGWNSAMLAVAHWPPAAGLPVGGTVDGGLDGDVGPAPGLFSTTTRLAQRAGDLLPDGARHPTSTAPPAA